MQSSSATKTFVILTCAAAVLPYALLIFMANTGRLSLAYRSSLAIFAIGSLTWTVLLLATLIVGRWQRKLFWLLALLPITWGPWLLMLYDWLFGTWGPWLLMLYDWLFGLKP